MYTKVGSLNMCRVINGLWQTSGGWGTIDAQNALVHMTEAAKNGFTSFDGADHYGPAEDLMGALTVKETQLCSKWCPSPASYSLGQCERAVQKTLSRMGRCDLLAFHWWDYSAWRGENVMMTNKKKNLTLDTDCCNALHHLNSLREKGLFANLALTNFNTTYVRQLIEEEHLPIVSNQVLR